MSRHDDNEQTGICYFCHKNRWDCLCPDENTTEWDQAYDLRHEGHFDD